MLSPNALLLPISVQILSGVWMVVPKRPTSETVPVTPPALTKSPTLKGFSITRNTPAAKFASRPLQATPIATPPAASIAANDVVWIPKIPRIAIIRMISSSTEMLVLR